MSRLLPQKFPKAQAAKLKDVTLESFGGGLNTVDNDLTMSPQYAANLVNFRRTPGGSQVTRFGSRWMCDVRDVVDGEIIDMRYFADTIIVVMSSGEIAAVTGDGAVAAIWNDAIAALLAVPASGWSETVQVSFVLFKNELIIHNGVDKPIIINSVPAVRYLADESVTPNPSNVFTPIGKYGCIVSNFHVIAGIVDQTIDGDPVADNPTAIYVSSQGTASVFPGDQAPNNSISIDVGAYVPEGAREIRGVAGFRTYLLVFFLGQTLIVKLGTFNDAGEHIPEFPDTMPTFGILGHRCFVQVDNDLLFAGINGLSSAKRNLFSTNLNTHLLSERIEPTYRQVVGELTDEQQQLNSFVVWDPLARDIIVASPSETSLVYSFNDKLGYKAWTTFEDQMWTSGCTSPLGRTFFSSGTRIFQGGNGVFDGEEYRADRIRDRDDPWQIGHLYNVGDLILDTDNDIIYEAVLDHISSINTFMDDRLIFPSPWVEFNGHPIRYEMELPWIASKNPVQLKMLKYISVGSKGKGAFTIKAYADGLFRAVDDTYEYDPALSMDFTGDDAHGFGYDSGFMGGSRRSGDPRLFKFPLKFKAVKFVFSGESIYKLELVNASFLYADGKFQR